MKILPLLILLSTTLIACQGNRNRDALATASPAEAPLETLTPPENSIGVDTTGLFGESPGNLQRVYFSHDAATLSAEAIAALQHNANLLRQHPEPRVLIAGHCDERGTQEYNLALGQRRAEAVRDYLVQLGQPLSRFDIISYGEEVPADPGQDETAWQQNRRCEFQNASRR